MDVTLREITQYNWVECINLGVTEEQKHRHAVAPNVLSLAQAYAERWWIPLGVYDGETMVGFVMYGTRPGDVINYILRVMVDARFQGRGYGKSALASLITRIREEDSGEIQLDYDGSDPIAVQLYTGAGFRPIEQSENGDVVASLI